MKLFIIFFCLILLSCRSKIECDPHPDFDFNSASIRRIDTTNSKGMYLYLSYLIDSSGGLAGVDTLTLRKVEKVYHRDSGSYYHYTMSMLTVNRMFRSEPLIMALQLDSTNYLAHRDLLLSYQKSYDVWSVRAIYPDSALKYKALFEATKKLGQRRLPNWCGWEIYLHDWGQ